MTVLLVFDVSVLVWVCLQGYKIAGWIRKLSLHPVANVLSRYHSDWEVVANNISEEVARSEFEFTSQSLDSNLLSWEPPLMHVCCCLWSFHKQRWETIS